MCGIAGFYGIKDDNLIKKISDQLSHRGPDGEGFYFDEIVTLLNRRLAIIDVKGGDQPIYNEDGSIVVVYNGEIYNYQALRKELEQLGHHFKTKADTEVIVHGYEQWQEKYFDRLNGMFAIALWDIKKQKLVLVRDHFGIKPLYYSIDSARIIFSSEIKPIFESGLVEKKPNDRIIYRYLKYRIHDDQKETFFKGIYKLMPGEMLIIQSEKLEVKSYSKLKEELLNSKRKEFDQRSILEFKKKLIEAVKLRLISEVPVGSCLSGGLDSSTVVSIVNKLLQQKIQEAKSVGNMQNVFSAIFPDGSNNEEKYVNEVLRAMKLKSHKIEPKPEEFFKEIDEFVKTQEEPTISTGPYAQYKVMEEASKNVTVLLDGQGADEMMAGYLPYYMVYFRQLIKEKKYLTLLKEARSAWDVIWSIIVKNKASVSINLLLNTEFNAKYVSEHFEVINNNLKKRLLEDIFQNSLPSLLRYEDRNSMHYSLEGRVPFLDFNLMKYLFSLPDQAIINLGWNKNILRQAAKNLLPALIVNRRNKIGFTTPEHQWFMRMKNKIYHVFLSESFAGRKYFNQPEVLKAFQEFIEGKNDDSMMFWRFLNLEIWLRLFFDSKSIKKPRDLKNEVFGEPNEGKKINIDVDKKIYQRFPVRTELFNKGDDYVNKILKITNLSINQLIDTGKHKKDKKWFLVVSEKIIAISQGRSYFLWEIKPSFFANILSNFVTKTPYGIGLGSPWTMQLAIREVGVIRVIGAAIIAGIIKPFGIKGMFYRIVGETVRSIDGPTEYSLYPSNVSAKLGPKEPQKVAEKIHKSIQSSVSGIQDFLGVIIIDANDLGQNVLGNSTNVSNKTIEKIFIDNPMGQADEQTPIIIVSSI